MQYAMLFYLDDEKLPQGMDSDALATEMAALRNELETAGIFLGSQRLCPPSTATTQCVRDGKTIVTDGPFSDTKECLAGFMLIEAADLEEALAWAERVPLARYGYVEVRPGRSCTG
jgi:hypothetical protein